MQRNRQASGRLAALSIVVVFALASTEAAGAGLIGNDYKGVLYDVNEFTGVLSNPRPTGLVNLCGIAYSANGTLYGFTNIAMNNGNPLGTVYAINPTTGAATLVGGLGLGYIVEGDLAFDPTTGNLYGVQDETPDTRLLFSINPSTGVGADIGTVTASNTNSTSDLSAMTFDDLGNLYVVDTGPSTLLRVNKSTGATISSINLSLMGMLVGGNEALGPTAGMAIDPVSGTAYLATGSNGVFFSTDSLYTLNLSTGALTLVGVLSGGTEGLAGLAFPPILPPSLSLTKTHAGGFIQGQANAQYSLNVTNSGGPTSGTVTVTENIPSGLTLVSMSGTGWICSSTTCARNDVLATNASYPALTATVNVASNAPSQVTNQASISGGGSPMATASDLTNVAAARTVTNVTSTTANGTYGPESSISIQVSFSGAVTVTGTPQLALNSGGTANYTSGSGTATLTLTYTVGASDSSAHLDYSSTSALTLNGGTINASLTLPTPGATGSLGANTNIVIGNGTVPPAFFTGEVSLGSGVYYLQFPDGDPFGYYNFPSGSILYHYDMGFEGLVPGSASDVYLYDFMSNDWWYTSNTLFPYLYDFTLNAWIYYIPNTTSPGHYTTNPRYFSNLTTGKIITM